MQMIISKIAVHPDSVTCTSSGSSSGLTGSGTQYGVLAELKGALFYYNKCFTDKHRREVEIYIDQV